MNDSEFEELVNLYFDQEISAADLVSLKQELSGDAERRHAFKVHYRLHKATCSVLSNKHECCGGNAPEKGRTHLSRWTLGTLSGAGMAACFLLMFSISLIVVHEPASDESVFSEKPAAFSDPMDQVETGKLEPQLRGNLSSQFRLAGLTPDISPSDQQLRRIDTEALQQKKAHLQSMVEQMDRYKKYTAMPKPTVFESFEHTYGGTASGSYLPVGFKSSLASF